MSIRTIKKEDVAQIADLCAQLGYPVTEDLIIKKIDELSGREDHEVVIYELDGVVVGFISLHFVPQLPLAGDFAIVSYFAVDENHRGKGIGKDLEEYAVQISKARGCDRIQLHSSARRTSAHRFYGRQGYEESPKYFSKSLN